MSYLLNRLTLVVVIVIAISGCRITGSYTEVVSVIKEDSKDISIYFCPRDDCEDKLKEFILSADEYVHCAFFDLDLERVKNALKIKNKHIDVKLIVDNDNYEIVEELGFVRHDSRSPYMHNKFCIIDGEKISSGSMNPTHNGANKNNNNLIIFKSSALANNYEIEFQELWNGNFGRGGKTSNPIIYLDKTKVENYFCPEDNCGEKIKDVLNKAEKSIYFLVFSFTHDSIANSLLIKNLENISIKGIFEKRNAGSQYSKYNVLKYQGIDVRKDNNSATMHHKVFIIDENIVITGSFNPSMNADTRNDENILIIYDKDVAKEYLEEFEYVLRYYS